MSNSDLIMEGGAADIGKFMVGRLLPFRKRRNVGPFIFDHMEPVKLDKAHSFDVLPNPHTAFNVNTSILGTFRPIHAWFTNLGNIVKVNGGNETRVFSC